MPWSENVKCPRCRSEHLVCISDLDYKEDQAVYVFECPFTGASANINWSDFAFEYHSFECPDHTIAAFPKPP